MVSTVVPKYIYKSAYHPLLKVEIRFCDSLNLVLFQEICFEIKKSKI